MARLPPGNRSRDSQRFVAGLPGDVREQARRRVIRRLRLFSDLGLTDRARELFPPAGLSAELRREIVVELDREIGFHRRREQSVSGNGNAQFPQLEQWREELTPTDLGTRVRDLTAREHHDVWAENQTDAPYEALADELTRDA